MPREFRRHASARRVINQKNEGNFLNTYLRRLGALAAAACASLALTACGGGGGGGTTTYFPFMGGSCATGYVGHPYSCTPNIGGLPPGSTPSVVATDLPPGVTINAATGELRGTPTTPGSYSIGLTLSASGASGSVPFTLFVTIGQPFPNAWVQVNAATPFPRFASQTAATLGTDLYVVGARDDNLAIETWRSSDEGVNWVKLPVSPAVAIKDFALASDGTRLLLTGGRDAAQTSSNGVQVFENNAWTSVPATGTTFPGRWGHSLTVWNGAWWLIGGTTGTALGANARDDVWRSSDNGATWTLATASIGASVASFDAIYAPSYGHCVGVVDNKLIKVGGSNSFNGLDEAGMHFVDSVRPWQSSDGINWSLLVFGSSQEGFTGAGCATVNGVLHNIGGTRVNLQDVLANSGSSAAVSLGSTLWTFDGNIDTGLVDGTPRLFDGSQALAQRFGIATAVIGNKLFVIGGRYAGAPDTAFSDVWVSTR